MTRTGIPSIRVLLLACLLFAPLGARSGTIQVTVVDGRVETPIQGAFVMIGPGKGIPFSGNTAVTNASGVAVFQNPAIAGLQTVTAGAEGYSYTALIEAAETAVTIPLSPMVPDTVYYGPTARITGEVTGIQTVNNDGNIDIALVLPAVAPEQYFRSGGLPLGMPPDTMNIPLVGDVVVPGPVSIPTQTEMLIVQISKPIYKIDLRAQTTQSMFAISARLPISLILDPPDDLIALFSQVQTREFGIERDRVLGNGATIPIAADINLQRQLTVRIEGAPNGDLIAAGSIGSLPGPGGLERIIGYDLKVGLADTTDTFLMNSITPQGDVSDVRNFVGGGYGDSSAYLIYQTGKIDRTPFTLPATRVLSDFYDPPTQYRTGARFEWSQVHDPGVEPAPSWALNSIRLAPIDPADSTVQVLNLWRVVVPADKRGFVLPSLPTEAPGFDAGLIDVDATPDADRLVWDTMVANPSGDLTQLLERPLEGVTHFSRREETLGLKPADVAEALRELPASFSLLPNPAAGSVRIRLSAPATRDTRLEIFEPSGRRVAAIEVPEGRRDAVWDGRDDRGRETAPGVYLIRPIGGHGEGGLKIQRVR